MNKILVLACLLRLIWIASSSPLSSPNTVVKDKKVYSLPLGTFPENLNVRSNGDVLISILTEPEIYQIAPNSKQDAFRVARFYNHSSVFAIVEMQEDVFYAAVGNLSFKTFKGEKGSFSIWKVDLRGVGTNKQLTQCQMVGRPGMTGCRRSARISKVLDVPEIQLLDGMTALNPQEGLLITGDSDSSTGQMYVLDVKRGQVRKAFRSKKLALTAGGILGLNGLKYYNDTLFFTNSAQETFGRVKVDRYTGQRLGQIEILIRGFSLDDFIFDDMGNLFTGILVGGGGVGYSKAPVENGSTIEPIALNIKGATATHFGTLPGGKTTLYVTDNGGLEQYVSKTYVHEGGLWTVDVSSLISS